VAAAESAFGDLKQLERELDGYLQRKRLTYLQVTGPVLAIGPIDVRPLTPGAGSAVPILAELKNDAEAPAASALAARLRPIQARYPSDPFVETALAEAELIAGNHAAAVAAADRALAADPRATEAMIFKGRALVEQLAKTDGATKDQFAQARSWFLRANKLDPEDPEPLYEFFRSFIAAGTSPTPNAIAALHYASSLAPQDIGLRMTSAAQHLIFGKASDARKELMFVAYSPHVGELSALARRMVARIDAGDPKGALEETRNAKGWTSG
jgi:tetratricopeptide (TPR) repeat protein